MSLFQEKNNHIPLAERMRPRDFKEFIGQEEIVGQGKFLRQAIENDSLFSMIFWGPPGIGKTTLAKIIARKTNSDFVYFSAVDVSTKEIKQIIQRSKQSLKAYQKRTIIFLDEIHRFNKAQQAIFLPYVEDGSIVLIASTTENPSFEVIAPLLSRCRVFIFSSLVKEDIEKIIQKTLIDKERGIGSEKIKIDETAVNLLAEIANGDARIALNILEIAAKTANKDKDGYKKIEPKSLKDVLQKKYLIYDKKGEEHYNIISAFIKSLRGSDADAALYWLARMLEAGEDPEFIARRMIIFASEDISNANPTALVVATSAFQALQFVGLPEAQLNLAQAVTYLAKSPKSNASYAALLKAKEDVKKFGNLPVPIHLRNLPANSLTLSSSQQSHVVLKDDFKKEKPLFKIGSRRWQAGAPTKFMEELGYGQDYPPATPERSDGGRGKYPHNFQDSQVKQQYLPDKLVNKKYYDWKMDAKRKKQ